MGRERGIEVVRERGSEGERQKRVGTKTEIEGERKRAGMSMREGTEFL